jgi:hypothetical protein
MESNCKQDKLSVKSIHLRDDAMDASFKPNDNLYLSCHARSLSFHWIEKDIMEKHKSCHNHACECDTNCQWSSHNRQILMIYSNSLVYNKTWFTTNS